MSASKLARHDNDVIDSAESQTESSIGEGFPALPTETEIYILPDGRVVVADLPAELAALVANLGEKEERSTAD